MHCDTENAVHPLTSMFGLLTRAGYSTGVFGKVTNDQTKVLPLATGWGSMTYIDSPVDYNSFSESAREICEIVHGLPTFFRSC